MYSLKKPDHWNKKPKISVQETLWKVKRLIDIKTDKDYLFLYVQFVYLWISSTTHH